MNPCDNFDTHPSQILNRIPLAIWNEMKYITFCCMIIWRWLEGVWRVTLFVWENGSYFSIQCIHLHSESKCGVRMFEFKSQCEPSFAVIESLCGGQIHFNLVSSPFSREVRGAAMELEKMLQCLMEWDPGHYTTAATMWLSIWTPWFSVM